ncbi:Uncharacterised protein [Mycobacterium tuberculosis]|uniref:Uncharacterized protein n=1 Tax=Mycobacterium tuberculosis TaxID=1773 RepID=A0A655JT63_MYCTX|nr:Uncharacterised protein [Mycobacterium tuberculosis]CKR15094.1 Uncharacterised protein [Mycobacterium tuberculosis]CKT25740.1 Uncharacterised protein [Mycobacterium tuberculosis]CNV54047.1 Uncharacterised protein [Mycobacterium tuberculosis]COX85545.1 Uncharacterised protein [Mycobacterium tuberculosis]
MQAPSAPVSFRWSKSETSTTSDASVEDGTNDSVASRTLRRLAR